MRAKRGFADRDERQMQGHTGDGSGLTADQIRQRVVKGQVNRLTAAQIEYAERRGWIAKVFGR